jgi:hypothetical protein
MRWEMVWAVGCVSLGWCCCCGDAAFLLSFYQGGRAGFTNRSAPPSVAGVSIEMFAIVLYYTGLRTGTGDLILGEDCRRRPLTGCWARKAGAARCLSMLKARVDCILCR